MIEFTREPGKRNGAVTPFVRRGCRVGQTVQYMRQLIDQGKKDPTVHERAAWILNAYHVPAFDFEGEYRAVFHWITKSIRWTRDPTGKEGLHSAAEILRLRIGDCDDFSILMCAMLGTIGHRTRLVTISNHPEDPETFSHIYPEVRLHDKWIPMDGGGGIQRLPKDRRACFAGTFGTSTQTRTSKTPRAWEVCA